ncbi:alpha-1,3/1,6-mannosyltransferase ALG2 isoform X2 [Pyxicephalus adspersus]|uniref:alpha-1,3/1,6-mannosyltransferase ALG2 isoform X2 n=1 Tax=Pyxicephalus adspersus TaxID=30357 RepID=UPI003B5CA87F
MEPTVLFIHPDLGIGGAERLVVDAALALKSRGCKVQVSACIPVFKLARNWKPVLFYCHFPDQLLTQRVSMIKKIYRAPIDWLEEKTTGMADCIVVNSKFTAKIFQETFSSLSHIQPDVLYPSLNVRNFECSFFDDLSELVPVGREIVFLSINRYERKKNLTLALKSLCALQANLNFSDWKKIHLIVAGGYDERVRENIEHYQELKNFAEENEIGNHITFLRSFSDRQKLNLFHNCTCILYTPSNEHFGIVPVEAMYMHCPVIAVNSGGPLESVVNNVTGFLCPPNAEAFADAMEKFVKNPSLKTTMGKSGHARVLEKFSAEAFTDQIYHFVCKLTEYN